MGQGYVSPRVIKEVIKKQGDSGKIPENFPESVLGKFPIGIDGIYADMFSGLNLEEQLRIGGFKETEIEYNDNYTLIVDKYYLNSENTNIYYELETKINNIINKFFTVPLELEEELQNTFLVTEENNVESASFLVTDSEKIVNLEDNLIEITLSTVNRETASREKKRKKCILFSRENNKIQIKEEMQEVQNR